MSVTTYVFIDISKQEHRVQCQYSAATAFFENFKSKEGHNYVKKNLRVTCPTGMGSLLTVSNYSEFQVNIFSNDRYYKMSKFLHDDAAITDDKAMTTSQHFLQKNSQAKNYL